MLLRNVFSASGWAVSWRQSIPFKILIEREENEEVLALYGGGRYVLSQDDKNWYAPIWYSWTPERRERHINDFRAATLKQTFVKPVNAGWKPGHQLIMWQQSEPSVIFDRIMSASTTSPTLVAPVANLSPSPSILASASTETATISLSPPITSTFASSQASSSQCISFEDSHQGRETIFEPHLRSELPKKISRCRWNCGKTITQSDPLLVRLYGISSWLDQKTGEQRSRHGPLYIHFQDNCLKAYDSKNYYAPNELFNYKQIKLDEETRKNLSDVDIIYL